MSFSNLLTGSPLLWRIARGQHSDPGGFICVGDRNWKLSPVLKFQNKNDKIDIVSKFKLSTIISYFFLWTAEHDVLTKHKIKRNTEVVVLSPILSLKAEQQRKVINLFSHTTRILLPASLYQKAQMLDLTAISLSLWPENQQKPENFLPHSFISALQWRKPVIY